MARPPSCRKVSGKPVAGVFKPAGIPASELDFLVLTLDELEAMKLADLEGKYQGEAAQLMHVSRPTFGRIIESAHRKVAEALVQGKALRIEGGPVAITTDTPSHQGESMNICIPIVEDKGLLSQVNGHFGSTPLFLIVDTDTLSTRAIVNTNAQHSHGMCQPLAVLSNEKLDAIVVGGIGMGALNKLRAAGIKVYMGRQTTVEQVITEFKAGKLNEVTPQTACAHHGQGHDHGHDHHHDHAPKK